MSNLRGRLEGVAFRPLDDFGVPEASKEALAFALIGYLTGSGLPASVPSCTGARRSSILGSITPGERPLPAPKGVTAPSRLVVHKARSFREGN
jgi:anhydro-N-acetylmuramic acid kinase